MKMARKSVLRKEISGATYNRLQYGPVPERYHTLFESIPEIAMDETEFGTQAMAVQNLEDDKA